VKQYYDWPIDQYLQKLSHHALQAIFEQLSLLLINYDIVTTQTHTIQALIWRKSNDLKTTVLFLLL